MLRKKREEKRVRNNFGLTRDAYARKEVYPSELVTSDAAPFLPRCRRRNGFLPESL
jgi:hypothetical protein